MVTRSRLPASLWRVEQFGKKARGFITEDALLLGVESRTFSPLRIPRETEKMMHPEIIGLYPCGEGAGYAGGNCLGRNGWRRLCRGNLLRNKKGRDWL